jgi:mannose-6-phosphate isomerase-like protein (cupin superfamily)
MIVRIFTGDDGQSHFEDLDAPTESVQRIATKAGEDLVFRKSAQDSFSDWHHPSRRQYLFVIDGRIEVSVGDGSSRRFERGDVLLAEDLTGQGHVTKSIGGSYTSVSVGLPD